MTYSFKIWTHPTNGSERLYVQGTTRQSLYLKLSSDGRLVWSSKDNDAAPKFRTGNHYGKINKDGEAAREACEAFGLELGGDRAEWDRALQIARDGIQVEG